MRFITDDPVRDEEMRQRAWDLALARRPVCDCCKRHIQDDQALHYTGGREEIWLCLECIEDNTELIED